MNVYGRGPRRWLKPGDLTGRKPQDADRKPVIGRGSTQHPMIEPDPPGCNRIAPARLGFNQRVD
jgi:hypothetical protein